MNVNSSSPIPYSTVRSRSSDNVKAGLKLGREPPVWVLDTASSTCQACAKKFSFIVRRHHCRCCGRLLCGNCSRYFVPLPYLDWQLARVCVTCEGLLNQPAPSRVQNLSQHRRSNSLSSLTSKEELISKLVRNIQIAKDMNPSNGSGDINLLPTEILAKIFNYLSYSDKRICRYVSRYWDEVITLSTFFHDSVVHLRDLHEPRLERTLEDTYMNTEFRHLKLHSCTMISNTSYWSQMSQSLRSLELISCEVTEKELTNVLLLTENLETLTLNDCRDLFMSGTLFSNEDERLRIQQNLKSLHNLNLNSNKYLSDVLLLKFCQTTPNLKALSMAGCNVMNDSGIYRKYYPESQGIQASPSVLTWRTVVRVVSALAPTLRVLDVSFNTGVDLEMLATVPELNLTGINFAGCGSVTLPGLRALLTSCPDLATIDLSMCRRVFTGLPSSVHHLFNAMANVKLQNLKLNLLSIASFRSLALIKNLKRLEVNNLDVPGAEVIQCLQDLNCDQLEYLCLKDLGAPPTELKRIVMEKNFPRLTSLDLSCGGETVTNGLLLAISRKMPNLQCLRLQSNPGISDAGVLGLSSSASLPSTMVEIKDWLAKKNKILLGSRQEQEIHMSKIQKEIAAEQLMEADNLDAGLYLLNKLTELDLSQTSITGLSLKLGISAPDLRKLNVENSAEIEDSALYDFAIRHPRLEELRIGFTTISDTSLISCLSCLPRLVHLNVSSCKNLSNAGVRAIGQIAPQLKTLVLSNCQHINMETARVLETSMPNLTVHTLGLQAERYQSMRGFHPSPQPPPPAPGPPPPPFHP